MTGGGPTVLVIGGGIVGTAAAAFLAEAGARVTLIEREGLASGASGANSGVVQHPFDPAMAVLYRETVALYRTLSEADAGFAIAPEPAGLLYISADERAVRSVDGSIAALFPELDREVLSGSRLQRVEPALAPGLAACRVGIGFPVQPGASTYAYATLAERHGARIRLGREALLHRRGDQVLGVVLNGAVIAADAVLIAAGPESSELIDPTGAWRPIRPRWGVVVEAEFPRGLTHVLEEAEIGAVIGVVPGDDSVAGANHTVVDVDGAVEDFSLVPLGGLASVGSTFLPDRPDPAAWVERLLSRASRFVPALANAPIRGTRSCPRPQSLDGRPLIGAIPGSEGLFICAGHGSWGLSTGPASARLIVDQILGRAQAIPAEFEPARFGTP